jgi:hypothetical protein
VRPEVATATEDERRAPSAGGHHRIVSRPTPQTGLWMASLSWGG